MPCSCEQNLLTQDNNARAPGAELNGLAPRGLTPRGSTSAGTSSQGGRDSNNSASPATTSTANQRPQFPFECSHCQKPIKTQLGKNQHESRYCEINPSSLAFKATPSADEHQPDAKVCRHCGKILPSVKGRVQHENRHCPQRPDANPDATYHECEFCNIHLVTAADLLTHQRVCVKNPTSRNFVPSYKCKFCNKEFSSLIGKTQHEVRYCPSKTPSVQPPSRAVAGPDSISLPSYNLSLPPDLPVDLPPVQVNKCSDCSASYPTKMGLCQHRRQAHPVAYNEDVGREAVKPKRVFYSDEEMGMVARAEIELVAGGVRNVNQAIYDRLKELPSFSRNLNGIINMRRSKAYVSFFQTITGEGHESELSEDEVVPTIATLPSNPGDEGVDIGREEESLRPVRSYLLASLDWDPLEDWDEERLNTIIRATLNGENTEQSLVDYITFIMNKPRPPRRSQQQRSSNPSSSATTTTSTQRRSTTAHPPPPINAKIRYNRKRRARLKSNKSTAKPTKAQRKRHQYALTQRLYDTDRRRLARSILDGRRLDETPGEHPGVVGNWCASFEETPVDTDVSDMSPYPSFSFNVWKPISGPEVEKFKLEMPKGAAGPDGVKLSSIKTVSSVILSKIFNLFMYLKNLPESLLISRTVLIPKVDNPGAWNEFRPISIASVVVRLFHRILAFRISSACHIDARQRGFLPVDGCADNLAILESVIGEARRKNKAAYIVSLDVKNAFGSVSHEALHKALELGGAPAPLIDYVKSIYARFRTEVSLGSDRQIAKINRGVLQGCPLSPILFNLVINQMLTKLPPHTGFPLGEGGSRQTIDGAAFADDLLTIANTAPGAHLQLQALETYGPKWGLVFNPKKCRSLALQSVQTKHRKRKIYTNKNIKFKLHGAYIEPVAVDESWKYLGMLFGYRGTESVVDGTRLMLTCLLQRLRKTCLKPQQKLEILRTFLVPRFIYKISNSSPRSGFLIKLDKTIRSWLKTMLRLPKDTPNSFFYAPVREGGLGILSFRASCPAMIFRRYSALGDSTSSFAKAAHSSETIQMKLRSAWTMLYVQDGKEVLHAKTVQSFHAAQLHSHIDGKALQHCSLVKRTHTWVNDHSNMFTGKLFVSTIRLRSNSIPTLARTSRGRSSPRSCRAGCRAVETLDHVLGVCARSWGPRRERHDKIVHRVKSFAEQLGYTVELEPRILIPTGSSRGDFQGNHCQPDLILNKNGNFFVIDALICGGNQSLRHAYEGKVSKYERVDAIREYCKRKGAEGDPLFQAIVINNRGVMASKSYKDLRELRFNVGMIRTLVVASLEGSIKIWNFWCRCTARHWLTTQGRW